MLKLANLIIVLLSTLCVVAIAAPYQELAPKPGYVPVYIREGNIPLSEVNPKLAEAFHEDEESNQPQLEMEIPKEVEITNNNKSDEVAENIQQNKEEETNDQIIQINKELGESQKFEKQEEEESPASDIAEFTNDDIKALADDKTDN